MSARRLVLVVLALAAGCSKTSTRPSLLLSGPSAVAVFKGFTTRDAASTRDYLAVANERGNELRILDATDGQAVLAPALVQALSVPAGPRPALLAAGGLHDPDPTDKADLLAVAATGLAACDPATPTRLSGCVQVVATWTAATALSSSLTVVVDDLPGGQDAAVLSLAVVPVPEPDGAGGFRPAAGRARLVAGLSGGRLLLADFARAADGVAIERLGAAVHDLGFDPVSLSGSPDRRHAYAASLDPIGAVEGVAELDLSGPFDQAPPVRAIPAGLPTNLVLAALVRPFVALGDDPKLDVHGPEVLRVYAALDPERCGREAPVPCGLAVLDPVAGGPVPDPAGELPAHLPVSFTGRALALVAVYPPALGGLKEDGTPATSAAEAAFQKQATETSDRWVSTLAALASNSGAIHLLDLARGAPALDRAVLATTTAGTQAGISAAVSSGPPSTDHPRLGLWDDQAIPPRAWSDEDVLKLLVEATPGYTPSDTWFLTFEGELPRLANLGAQLQSSVAGDGLAWLAVQAAPGSAPEVGPYRQVARLYDPRSLVRPGDIAVVTPLDAAACPAGAFELEVTGFLPPDPALHPGGAVTVAPRAVQPTVDGVPGDPRCLDAAGRSVARVTFRAGGLILTGSSFGYAGRPAIATAATEPGFSLAWEDTSGLSCPLLDSTAWPPATCDQACRDACERILLARKARRIAYVAEKCLATDAECAKRWGADPVVNPRGPVLAFKPAWVYEATADGQTPPARDTFLQVSTSSGLLQVSRRPLSGSTPIGATLPSGLTTFDRSAATGLEASGMRVFTAYPSNLVLDFSPSLGASAVTIYK